MFAAIEMSASVNWTVIFRRNFNDVTFLALRGWAVVCGQHGRGHKL